MQNITIQKIGITELGTQIIVNAANSELRQGSGVCGYIFESAGAERLSKACREIGGCPTGDAVITPGFKLCEYIVHAVGPIWQGGSEGEASQLYSCYQKSLDLASGIQCRSIGFPLISSGIFGYPKEGAWTTALTAVNDWFKAHPDYDIDVRFAIIDDKVIDLGKRVAEKLHVRVSVPSMRQSEPSAADEPVRMEGAMLRLNQNGMKIHFQILDYEPDVQDDDAWVKISADFKFRNVISYRMEKSESFLHREVIELKKYLDELLEGKLKETVRYELMEPDFEFVLFPAGEAGRERNPVASGITGDYRDAAVKFIVHLWNEGLTDNVFGTVLGRREAEAMCAYLKLITGELKSDDEEVQKYVRMDMIRC